MSYTIAKKFGLCYVVDGKDRYNFIVYNGCSVKENVKKQGVEISCFVSEG